MKLQQSSKPIRMIIPTKWLGSSLLRGHFLSEKMRESGIDASVIERKSVQFDEIKNSILVFIKQFNEIDRETLIRAKENGNIIVWNPVDVFAKHNDVLKKRFGLFPNKGSRELRLFDGVIFPNRQTLSDFAHLFHSRAHRTVIWSFADPRWRQMYASSFRLAYLGASKNLSRCFRVLDDLESISAHTDGFFQLAQNYSCHLSVREEGTADFLYKPHSKLVGAAASSANIVLTRDSSNLELLNYDYPYYTDSDLESVKQTIQYARDDFGHSNWRIGLDMLQEVRERTTIERITQDYIDYLQQFE